MEDVKVNLEIAALISRKAKGLLSREESDRLKDWKRESHENQQIYDCVWSRIQGANPCEKSCKKFDPQKAWNIVSVRIDERPAHKVFFVPLFYKSAAAAAFLFLSGWLLFRWYNLPQPAEEFAFSEIEKPVLILSDSEVIDLEENKKAWIKGEIRHKEKELKYNQSKKNKPFKKTEMHTLAIPEGMCYALELSDGTRVQLNSRTTLRYPASCSGRERKVYLEGEALFEVAKDKAHPFVVESKQLRTQVFGTVFNMKVYSGDESVHTTLVEGKVKVEVMDGKRVKHSAFLMPDMQYKYCAEDKKVRIKKVDSKKFTQWMDHFQFNNETLKTIFRKMSRWYGVKFKVLDKELGAIRFSGQIKHFEDFTDVLELLKYKTNISFKILDDAVLIEKITGEDR